MTATRLAHGRYRAAMPSAEHEHLVELFRNRPARAVELIRAVGGPSVPPFSEAALAGVDQTEVPPAHPSLHRRWDDPLDSPPVLLYHRRVHTNPLPRCASGRRVGTMALLLVIACAAGVGCVGGREGGAGVGPDGRNAHYYGRTRGPSGYACREDETDRSMGPYVVCLPRCSVDADCPAAPTGATAEPTCEGDDYCVLACSADSECPSEMVCTPSEYCAFQRQDCTDGQECPPGEECRELPYSDQRACNYPI